MNPRKLTFLVSLLTALAIVFALFAAGKARVLESVPTVLRQREQDLQQKIRDAKRARIQAQSAVHVSAEPAALADRPATFAPAIPVVFQSDSGAMEKKIAITPSLRSRYLQLYKMGFDDEWGLFIAALKLPPDQADKFKDLMVQREDNSLQLKAVEQGQGLAPSSPVIQALDDQLDRANKAAIAELLGQQGYSEWVKYHHEEAVLPVLGDLATDAQLADAPLSLSQATQMGALLAASSAKNENNAAVKGTIDWQAAAAKSSSILSPQQMPVFVLLQERYQTEQQYKQLSNSIVTGKPGP